MSAVSNNTSTIGSQFQAQTFLELRSDSDGTLANLLAGLDPMMMIILMQVLQNGTATESQRAKLNAAGINGQRLNSLIDNFKSYMGTWTASSSSVEAWMAELGFDRLTPDQQAKLADAFKDGSLSNAEVNSLKAAGVFSEEQYEGIQEAFNWAKSNNMDFSSMSLDALAVLQDGSMNIFSIGDIMLLLFIICTRSADERIKAKTELIASKQLALRIQEKKYSDILARQPGDPESDEYRSWQTEKEQAKMDLDRMDTEVQELTAELKRLIDKKDMIQKIFQGMIEQIGNKEKELAGSIAK